MQVDEPASCPSNVLPAFGLNWPQPTTSIKFDARVLAPGADPTVFDAAQTLEALLKRAGYPQPKFLGAGCKGVVVAANFEAIDDQGRRKRGLSGFPASSEEAAPGLPGAVDFVMGLFYAPPGYYRRIVFVITNDRPQPNSSPVSETALFDKVEPGAIALPVAYQRTPLTPDYQVYTNIYEFRLRTGENRAEQIQASGSPLKGLLTALSHLRAARLFTFLPQ